ncbi:MAG TPA: hypothetical protein VN616_12090 [Puia sp.]|nr:hypothetical protein [Puia sp.]
MKKLLIISGLVVLIATGVSVTGCYKDIIVPPITESGPPPSVSFNNQILPILTTSCAKSGCHVPGSQTPYMDSAEAYRNLINGGFVNTAAPSQSIIYQELNGGPMQVNIPSQADINLIYYWIENGAPNN